MHGDTLIFAKHMPVAQPGRMSGGVQEEPVEKTAPAVVMIADLDGRIILVNDEAERPSARRGLDRANGEMRGRAMRPVLSSILADDSILGC